MSRTIASLAASALALTLIPLAALASPAHAVDDQLVVDAGGARVVIEQSPFRLSITDADGATVLQEVAHATEDTIAEPPTTDPLADGSDNQSTTTLYSPLSFMVGTEDLKQQLDGEWIANLSKSTRSGTWYAAQDVKSVEHDGDDLVLTLSTNDPSGRTLEVRVGAQGEDAARVQVHAVPAEGVAMIGDSFETPAEAGQQDGFFGFGGRHDHLDQRGRVLSSFVNQESLDIKGDGKTMFPNGPAAAYYPQAMFYTTHYGFLLPQPELARFKLAVDRQDAWNVTASASHLDYIVAPGAPSTSVDVLTAMTGRHHTPPDWALGPMLDRLVKNDGETYQDYQANLAQDIVDIDRYKLPLSAYRIEGWGFPHDNHGLALHTWVHAKKQATMIRQLKARGIHPLAYIRPWLEPGLRAGQGRLRRDQAERQALHRQRLVQPPVRPRRLHQPRRGRVVAAPGEGHPRPRLRRVHAGLRRAGHARHALRRRQHRRRPGTTTTSRSTPRRPATRSTATRPITRPGTRGSSPAPATPDCRAPRRTRTRTSPATRPPTGAAPPGSSR